MNKDIIEYLEGYWEECNEPVGTLYYYQLSCDKGNLEYHPKENVLYIWNGLGVSDDYGYEVEIQDLQHLIQLEALL